MSTSPFSLTRGASLSVSLPGATGKTSIFCTAPSPFFQNAGEHRRPSPSFPPVRTVHGPAHFSLVSSRRRVYPPLLSHLCNPSSQLKFKGQLSLPRFTPFPLPTYKNCGPFLSQQVSTFFVFFPHTFPAIDQRRDQVDPSTFERHPSPPPLGRQRRPFFFFYYFNKRRR